MKYNVMVGGNVVGTYNNKADAEARLAEVKASFLALVHPSDTMFVKVVA